MAKIWKYKFIYIISFLLILVSIGGAFLAYGISIWANYTPFPYYIILLSFSFLYGLGAYLSGDIVIIKYRKEVGEFNPVLPKEVEEKVFLRRLPFIISLIVTLLVTGVLFIISLFIGGWPLL